MQKIGVPWLIIANGVNNQLLRIVSALLTQLGNNIVDQYLVHLDEIDQMFDSFAVELFYVLDNHLLKILLEFIVLPRFNIRLGLIE